MAPTLLGLLALLVAWLLLCPPARSPAVPVPPARVQPTATRPRGPAFQAEPAPEEPPAAGELLVRWCPELDVPRELFMALGYLDTRRVERVALPRTCLDAEICSVPGLPEGPCLAIQGAFARVGRVGPEEPTTLDLGCVSACGARVVVHPLEGCARAGSLELYAGWGDATRAVLASTRWEADEPFVLGDLPCLPDVSVVLRAAGCEPRDDGLALEEARAPWTFELRPTGHLLVQVLDAETEAPIEGVRLVLSHRFEALVSDAEGWVGPFALEPGDLLPFLHKAGFAGRDLRPGDFEDDDVFVARLHPILSRTVRCDDGGRSCPPETGMLVEQNSPAVRFRRCTRTEERLWDCPAIEGDRARACAGPRCSESEPLLLDGQDTVHLPPLEGAICLRWPPESPDACTLSFGAAEDAAVWPCERCGESPAARGVAVPVPLLPGEAARVTLRCAEGTWSGEVAVDQPGAAPCPEVELQPLGVICAPGRGACRAHARRPELHLDQAFNGCSEPLPAGPWSVSCEGRWYDLELPAGETVEVQGPGQSLEEQIEASVSGP
ncbi:MAG: hypothetical protein ABIO70_00460 [Pseudomonadota bacterium]